MPLIARLAMTASIFFSVSSCQRSDKDVSSKGSTESIGDISAIVYRSTDGGTSWQPFGRGIPNDATVSAFVVDADQRVFAATDFHGIYTVADGEHQWLRLDSNLPDDADINAMALMPNAMVIGTRRHGILISVNGGTNWAYSTSLITSAVRSLHRKNSILFAGADNGIYRSIDNGNTWSSVMKGAQVNGFTTLGNELYAALSNGAVKSLDDGRTWVYVYDDQTLHDISSDEESVYAMTLGAGLLRSLDQGNSWEGLNGGLGAFNFYTFEVKPFGQRKFAAQWHGIYEWNEQGAEWLKITAGLPDSTAFTTLEATGRGLIAGIGLRK